MLASSAGFAAMVDGAEQIVDARVNITLPGGVYPDVTVAVESVKIDAAATSSQPGSSRVAAGVPAITAEIVLSGMVDESDETKTVAWLFGSWQTTSPLYRQTALQCPITVDVGLVPDAGTPELLRKFTGYVDRKVINSDGTVTLSCVDSRNRLRGTVSSPAVVTAPPYNAGLTSEFAVDYVLRAATGGQVGSWPKQRPSCLFAASLRGSLWPEVGSLSGTSTQPIPVFAPGAFGTALQNYSNANGFTSAKYGMAAAAGDTFFMEWWTCGDQTFQTPWLLSVSYDQGFSSWASFTVEWGTTGFLLGPTVVDGAGTHNGILDKRGDYASMTASPHYMSVKVSWPVGSASWTAVTTIDGVSKTYSGTVPSSVVRPSAQPLNTLYLADGSVSTGAVQTIEALQVSSETAPATNYGFTPAAVLQPSKNRLVYVPGTEGDPAQTLQTIAEAELAVAGFDESGVFRFVNRDSLRSSPMVRTLTMIEALDEDESLSTVINHSHVEYAGASFGSPSFVWSQSAAVNVPRGGSLTIVAQCDTPVTSISTTPMYSGALPVSSFRASADQYGVNPHPSPSSLTWLVTQTAADQVSITVRNASGTDAWLVSPSTLLDVPAGTPWLKLAGVAATVGDAVAVESQWPPLNTDGTGGAASSTWGDIVASITGNPWIQDPAVAAELASDIVEDMPYPRPDLTNLAVVPDPRLQLMDRVSIVEPDAHGINGEHAVIFAWTLNLSATDWSMDVDARTVGRPGGWLLGVTGRSELASTTYV